MAPTAAKSTGSTAKNDDSAIARTSPAGSPAPGPANVVAPSFETSTPRAVAITSAGPGHSRRCTQVSRDRGGGEGARRRPASAAARRSSPRRPSGPTAGSATAGPRSRARSARPRFQVCAEVVGDEEPGVRADVDARARGRGSSAPRPNSIGTPSEAPEAPSTRCQRCPQSVERQRPVSVPAKIVRVVTTGPESWRQQRSGASDSTSTSTSTATYDVTCTDATCARATPLFNGQSPPRTPGSSTARP